ncbi:MAG: glycosyltransferase [Deltaproteobacteria bacterium]|nr:glycosyltransferase [Deltaproteobacteria bacterium]
MRVVVDLQAFPVSTAPPTVIDHYCASLACAILRHAGDHEVHVVINHSSEEFLEKLQGEFPDLCRNGAFRASRLPFLDTAKGSGGWHRAAAELVREHALLQLQPEIVLCIPLISASTAIVLSQLRCTGIPTAIALSKPPYATRPESNSKQHASNASELSLSTVHIGQRRQAELVLTISEYCKRQLLEVLELQPEHVVVVPPGVDERFRPAAMSEAQAHSVTRRFALNQDFILSIAGGTSQDIERLLEAYALLPSELRTANRLAIVGVIEGGESRRLMQLARSYGLADGELVFTGETSDDELAVLYDKCKLLVLPSLEEVSAQQALDAMSHGTPVLGPDHASIPEILGVYEMLFDPASARQMSEKICQVLASAEFRQKLKINASEQARRFSWRDSVRRSFEALDALRTCRSADSKPHPPLPKRRPRMAYLSPLPPERSGIADYSAELLPELARYYEIELITDLAQVSDPYLQEHFRRMPFRHFEKSARSYQCILYHIGNSPFHSQIPSLLEHYPGPVVLHDFYLSHLFKHLETTDGVSLWRNLYVSHGYPGLLARARKGAEAAIWAYPCNLAVLSHASGIIVHSDHARQLAHEWFGISTESWKVIPQLRRPSPKIDRHKARKILGISPDTFLVCSFGFLAPTKLNDLLFQSWLGSSLASIPNCCLVFAGGDGAGRPYQINDMTPSQVRATGYLSKEEYELYLAAADVGVQLRGELSRGETPRSVLDCMAQGLATIVSSHPALAELPADSVLRLPANCGREELMAALERLYREPGYRMMLGQNAQQYVGAKRSPALIAQQYAEAMEEFASNHPAAITNRVGVNLAKLASKAGPSDDDFAAVASCIAENSRTAAVRQLLVDVTVLVSLGDEKTGIHRTTRGILAQLLENPPSGWRVEPVYRGHRDTYRYARKLVRNYLHLEGLNLEDAPVAVNPGDVFLGLDWDPGIAIDDRAANWLLHHRQRGMRTVFTIYDLLPLQHSEWFKPEMQPLFQGWLSRICRIADGFACISRAVADELVGWLDTSSAVAARAFDIGYFHLGSDLETSWASQGLSPDEQKLLDTLKGREVLVMIGTVEPRKGHSQALSAMEHLWAEGVNLSLVICGRQGWMVDEIAQQLRSHPELGHRLFWMEQATDEALLQLYAIASGALMASGGEGFGLPLVEAAKHGVPIIARDLPVFREVAGEHAFYFSGHHTTDLADALRSWLMLYRRGAHPESRMMPWLTWQQSTQQLLRVALEGSVYEHWRRAPAPCFDQPAHATANGAGSAFQDRRVSLERQYRTPQHESGGERLVTSYGAAAEPLPAIINRTD